MIRFVVYCLRHIIELKCIVFQTYSVQEQYMDIFTLFSFVGGLGLFLFGMNVLGEAIGRQAGGKMKGALEKITSNRLTGIALGAGVTAIIQSSGATTVMLMGFINSGIMSLSSAIGPILGANIGTTVTAWLLALNDISGDSLVLRLLNPSTFVPILAFIGAILLVFCKRDREKDVGIMLLGFAVLMFGMSTMSSAMSPLRESDLFKKVLFALSNPILGVLFGFLMAAVLQSSSASVGIIQAAAITGAISVSNALPLIMGINIGAGLIVLLASSGTNRDAKRAAWIYVLHNTIGALFFLILLGFSSLTSLSDFLSTPISSFDIAILHTVYKLINSLLQLPFFDQLIWLSRKIVPPQKEEQKFALLDDNFLKTPPVAVLRCEELCNDMAELSKTTVFSAINVIRKFDENGIRTVRELEEEIDVFEDKIGEFLVKLSGCKLTSADSQSVTRMLHSINDLERISDHAKNIAESGEELRDKDLVFSEDAKAELEVIFSAVQEVTDLAVNAFVHCDYTAANHIDPLEQVVDDLKDALRDRHIRRLQRGECSTTLGFVFTDILTDLERISDHCSNIAMSVLQMRNSNFETHSFEAELKRSDAHFSELYDAYAQKYALS